MSANEEFGEILTRAAREGRGLQFNLLPVEALVRWQGKVAWRPTALWRLNGKATCESATVLIPDRGALGQLPGVNLGEFGMQNLRFAKKLDIYTTTFLTGVLRAETAELCGGQELSAGDRMSFYEPDLDDWRAAWERGSEGSEKRGDSAKPGEAEVEHWLGISSRVGVMRLLEAAPCQVYDQETSQWWETVGVRNGATAKAMVGEEVEARLLGSEAMKWGKTWTPTQRRAQEALAWTRRTKLYQFVLGEMGIPDYDLLRYPLITSVCENGLDALREWKKANGVWGLAKLDVSQWGFSSGPSTFALPVV